MKENKTRIKRIKEEFYTLQKAVVLVQNVTDSFPEDLRFWDGIS